MDINQKILKSLLAKTDTTFELFKESPNSECYADAYEQAKNELDLYMAAMRSSIQSKLNKR
jgi:hypothetical protein